MGDFGKAIQAIREENLDGWLFYNIFHRDEISDLVLGVSAHAMNTRPWACFVFPDRPARKIVHAIERGILDHVPGEVSVYGTRAEFLDALAHAAPGGSKIAAQFSPRFPVVSFLDHGIAILLKEARVTLVSSDEIVVSFLGTLDEAGRESHERAGKALYAIVAEVWQRLSREARDGRLPHEGDVRSWMIDLLEQKGLETEETPMAAFGPGSADPHYSPEGPGRVLFPGAVVQLDIWAKEKLPGSVYGDISWVGVFSSGPDARQAACFDAVRRARDLALETISLGLGRGAPPAGETVDRAVRAELTRLGYAAALRHRTGHSIGTRVHGYGVNLDCVEFPDQRLLREGSCFSIEPGVYLEDFGMRTEIDAYIKGGRLHVSGGDPQERLLTMEHGI